MAIIPLGGLRGEGRFVHVSDHRVEHLPTLEWRVKRFQSGYEQVIRSGAGGWKFPLARVIMEQIIGRVLLNTEHVHHRDEDTLNNTDENLILMTKGQHIAEHNRRSRSYERAEQAATTARRADPTCGTYPTGGGRWRVWYLGKYIGTFATREEAAATYRQAVEEGPEALPGRLSALRERARGVRQWPDGRWTARFCGKRLGHFQTESDAVAVYRQAVAERKAAR